MGERVLTVLTNPMKISPGKAKAHRARSLPSRSGSAQGGKDGDVLYPCAGSGREAFEIPSMVFKSAEGLGFYTEPDNSWLGL